MKLPDLVEWLDDLLEAQSFTDYGPNGLQVEGREDVRKIVGSVSVSRALFEDAARKDPRDFRFSYSLGMVEQALGHDGAALRAFERAIANNESATEPFLSEMYVRAITLLIASGDRIRACELLHELERRVPGDARTEALRARACH